MIGEQKRERKKPFRAGNEITVQTITGTFRKKIRQ